MEGDESRLRERLLLDLGPVLMVTATPEAEASCAQLLAALGLAAAPTAGGGAAGAALALLRPHAHLATLNATVRLLSETPYRLPALALRLVSPPALMQPPAEVKGWRMYGIAGPTGGRHRQVPVAHFLLPSSHGRPESCRIRSSARPLIFIDPPPLFPPLPAYRPRRSVWPACWWPPPPPPLGQPPQR